MNRPRENQYRGRFRLPGVKDPRKSDAKRSPRYLPRVWTVLIGA